MRRDMLKKFQCQFEDIGKKGRKDCIMPGNVEVIDKRNQKHWQVCYVHYLHLGPEFDKAEVIFHTGQLAGNPAKSS